MLTLKKGFHYDDANKVFDWPVEKQHTLIGSDQEHHNVKLQSKFTVI